MSTNDSDASAPTTRSKRNRDVPESSPRPAKRTRDVASSGPLPPTLEEEHCRKVHKIADQYVEMASDLVLYPLDQLGPYGFDSSQNSFPIEAVSTLAYLKSPVRRPSVIERWSPYEIALFEASIAEYGKDFFKIAAELKSKTTKEVIDFYYIWKKTVHYKRWKDTYVPPYLDVSDDEHEEDGEQQAAK